MININSFYQSFNDLANPAVTGDSYSPDQFNRELPIVVISAIRRHLGLPENYAPAMPQPAIAYEKTQMITDELLELKTTADLFVNSVGLALLPTDYYYPSSVNYWVQLKKQALEMPTMQLSKDECCDQKPILKPSPYYTEQKRVDILNDDEFNTMAASKLHAPSMLYPKCRFYDKTHLEFAPKNLFMVKFTYVRLPKVPKWNYVVDVNTLLPVFTAIGSQDIELPVSMTDTLRSMMLQRLGIPQRENELYQYGTQLKQQGA